MSETANDNISEPELEVAPELPEDQSTAREAEHAEEVASLKDKLLRAVAETENVRKRAQRDQEETSKYAVTSFARDMISVAENLQRALSSLPEEQSDDSPMLQSLRQGVKMTLSELLGVFERHGIRRVDPMGEKFDHHFHQAVAQIEVPDAAPGTIVQVMQAGYMIHDRLLRPAMVGVAKQGEVPRQVDTTA